LRARIMLTTLVAAIPTVLLFLRHIDDERSALMASAKRIVEQHGGAIAIDSKENVGTRVCLRLPCVVLQNDGVGQAA
jgi:hypothetical protein